MQRGNFKKPNKNYQRNPARGNAPVYGNKRKSDPWARAVPKGKPAPSGSSEPQDPPKEQRKEGGEQTDTRGG